MDVKLQILVGGSAGQKLSVAAPLFLIGRADECNLRPKSAHISRRHCEISQADSRATVRDLNSRTGTWVNGIRIPTDRAVELQTGDRLKIGPLEFEVQLTHSLGGKKKPKVDSIEEAASRTAQATRTDVHHDDVSQWLLPDDVDLSLGDTQEESPGARTIVSAADFMSLGDTTTTGKTEEQAADSPGRIDPRTAATEALKRHLRRG
ncbi:MAG: FHA domain-containing protein [Planctomycetia bacterium]|nr:FHA domain-containing protein [Planctomycetia bacterium]